MNNNRKQAVLEKLAISKKRVAKATVQLDGNIKALLDLTDEAARLEKTVVTHPLRKGRKAAEKRLKKVTRGVKRGVRKNKRLAKKTGDPSDNPLKFRVQEGTDAHEAAIQRGWKSNTSGYFDMDASTKHVLRKKQ